MTFPSRLFSVAGFLAGALLLFGTIGCGIRETHTGSLEGRIYNQNGDVVPNAQVYSLFNELEKAKTAADGSFYISELPAGQNRLMAIHSSYRTEETVVEILPNKHVTLDKIVLEFASASQKISETAVEAVTSATAVLTWKTYKPFKCRIEYGETRGYGTTLEETDATADHRFTINHLTPETIYHARVGFFDDDAAFRFSVDLPFKTAPPLTPLPPAALKITGIPTYGVINLAWEPSSTSSVNSYRLYRRAGSGPWAPISQGDFGLKETTFTDLTASGGVFFEYAVTAIDSNTAESAKTLSGKAFMPGHIQADVTLTASDSPVLLTSDLIVAHGATLNVAEGVEFQVAASDSFGLGKDAERVEILVMGRIIMVGTEVNPVRFTPLSGVGKRNYWAGIRILNSGTAVSEIAHTHLSGCASQAILVNGAAASLHDLTISYSDEGMRIEQVPNVPTISNCLFQDMASAAITFDQCRIFGFAGNTITDVRVGVNCISDTDQNRIQIYENSISSREEAILGTFRFSSIRNNILISRRSTGIRVLNAVDDANYIDHNTIDSLAGIKIDLGLPVVENNLILSRTATGTEGIRYLPTGNPPFAFNNLFGFTTAYLGCVAGEGARAVEPDFRNETPFLYTLPEASLLKYADRNGNELGRWGKSFR